MALAVGRITEHHAKEPHDHNPECRSIGERYLGLVRTFAFAKIVYMPAWAALLPSAFLAPCVIALPCLVPAALFTTSVRAGVRSLLWVALLAPMPALVMYAANPIHQHSGLPLNLAFQYVWIVGSGLLLPASGLLGVRTILKSMAFQR